MDRLTRRELKQDQLRTTYEGFEEFAKTHYKDILGVVGVAVVVVGLAAALKFYMDRQEAEANAQLGAALKTFRAYVGNASPEVVGADSPSFPTAQEKYKKALQQFTEVVHKFPRQNAAAIARYHVGVCQAALGDQAAAIKVFMGGQRRDITTLLPNDEVIIFMRWDDFLGKYIMHCHNVVHEDHAMMIRWDIVPSKKPGGSSKAAPALPASPPKGKNPAQGKTGAGKRS